MIEMIDENQNEDIKEDRLEKEVPKTRKVSKTKRESKVKEESKVMEEMKAKNEPKTKRESKSKKEVKAKRVSKKIEENDMTPPPSKTSKRSKTKSSVEMDQLWFEPDRILGATDRWHGQMAFRFKVKDSDEIEILPAKMAKVLCPQLVINFYQDHLIFFDSKLD